jgi:hypothetical protein
VGDASTNRDRCCRGGRECPRATGSPRRLVPPSSGSQDRRPSPPSTPSRPLKFSETKQACVHLSSPPDHTEVLVTRYRPASVRHCRQTTIGIGATGRKRAACDGIRALHPSARSAAGLEPTASRRRHRVAPDRGDAHFAQLGDRSSSNSVHSQKTRSVPRRHLPRNASTIAAEKAAEWRGCGEVTRLRSTTTGASCTQVAPAASASGCTTSSG